MAIKAVLWDLDGTLVATQRLYPEAYRRALAPFLGRELPDEELFNRQFHSELALLRHHVGDRFDECHKEFVRHYTQLHDTHYDGIYDGIPEVLAKLRSRDIPMGIVTGKSRGAFDVTMAAAALGQFDVIVVDDDVREPKPSPEGILIALDALKVDARDAIYIGDSLTDLEAGLAAGTRAAGALWGKTEARKQHFIEHYDKSAILLYSPQDLLSI